MFPSGCRDKEARPVARKQRHVCSRAFPHEHNARFLPAALTPGPLGQATPRPALSMPRLNYRPEIDGLRALAVLPVVFFHTQLEFPGGYVGVDIFFVISGFLITSLVHADVRAGTFSLAAFWVRRIRRIAPAAIATVLGSLLLGLILMLPPDFEDLGRSAMAQAVGAANIYFYTTSSYFDAPAHTKPLLHFWSLAVEEQFYLFLPPLLVLLARWRPRWLVRALLAIGAVSFVVSAVGAWRFPDAAFYLLPSRAWELALGGLLALRGCTLPLPDRARTLLGWAGVALMVVPMFLYTPATPFPGLAAVPPCLGAALVIWSTAMGESTLKRALSWRPVVFIGLLSYSLYLWHWPVKVFSHYWFTGIYSPAWMRLFSLAVSFVLAWLSWRYIEAPFRERRVGRVPRRLVAGFVAASAATLALDAVIGWRDGVPSRFPPQIVRYASAYDDRLDMQETDLTDAEAGRLSVLARGAADAPSLLLWSDSHARSVSPAVQAVCAQNGVTAFRATRSATAPLLDWGDDDFRRYNGAIFAWIKTHRPSVVLLVSRWEKVLRNDADEVALRATVAALREAGVRVAIMRQVPSQQNDVPKSLALAALLGRDVHDVGVSVAEHFVYTRRSNSILDDIARTEHRLIVLDPIPYLSRNGHCIAESAGHALYFDNQHLTLFGAGFLRPLFAALVRRVEAPRHHVASQRSVQPRALPRS